jgi:uncharacterized SAM-binding protein YcdF (DUF218 family)
MGYQLNFMKDKIDISDSHIDKLAKKIWDYHHTHHTLRPADAIIALGSNDTRVAERAVELFKQGYAPYLVFSGNTGALTKKLFSKPEAEVFADIATRKGVPESAILIENRSTNTGENIRFTKALLEEKAIKPHSIIAVQKPYMERRTYATVMKLWPEIDWMITSPQLSFEEYPTPEQPKELAINIMVGDLQRIRIYPDKGFQIPQPIPEDVWRAYEELVGLGYTKHMIECR